MTNRDKILQKTNGGLDVFIHYMGKACTKKLFRNPFRTDNSPSCHLYYHDNKYGEPKFVLKDFGDSDWYGDCFWLVGRLCSLTAAADFPKILSIIISELNLDVDMTIEEMDNYSPVVSKVQYSDIDVRPLVFIPKIRNYNRYELEYWEQYGINKETLNQYNVRALSSCYFERKDGSHYNIYSSLEVPMFGYLFNADTGIKAYRPNAKIGRFMYAGSLPQPYVFGLEQLSAKTDTVIITGGEKDVLCLSSHGFEAICLNSETAHITIDTLRHLVPLYKNIVFLYDSDKCGIKESALRVNECIDICEKNKITSLHIYSITLPLSGTKKEKDVSDFFRMGRRETTLRKLLSSVINHPQIKSL